jgi:hypothetical protein
MDMRLRCEPIPSLQQYRGGGSIGLPAEVHQCKAKGTAILGEKINAQEALRSVNRVADAESTGIATVVDKIAAARPPARAQAADARSVGNSLERRCRGECLPNAARTTSSEGVSAFARKRKAVFNARLKTADRRFSRAHASSTGTFHRGPDVRRDARRLGADVIRVERIEGGDDRRYDGPTGETVRFPQWNRNAQPTLAPLRARNLHRLIAPPMSDREPAQDGSADRIDYPSRRACVRHHPRASRHSDRGPAQIASTRRDGQASS